MEAVQMFKASDGEVFPTEKECKLYEDAQLIEVLIEDFMVSEYCPYKKGMTRTVCSTSVKAWEAFRNQ